MNEELEDNLEDITDDDKEKIKTKSFLKWAGGKSKVFNKIKSMFPKKIKRFIEPFTGSMVVSLNVEADSVIVNDSNSHLINLYMVAKDNCKALVKQINILFVDKNNSEEMYYKLRDEFNSCDDHLRKSALFVYLNRFCFNGLCRYNREGMFNVPYGKKKNLPEAPIEAIKNVSERIQGFEIYNDDYKNIFKLVKKGDVVYCDPPYLPFENKNVASFTAYSPDDFGLFDHINLAYLCKKAVEKGAIVIVSNHDTWTARQIYHQYGGQMKKMEVARYVAAHTDNRDNARELLVSFSKKELSDLVS